MRPLLLDLVSGPDGEAIANRFWKYVDQKGRLEIAEAIPPAYSAYVGQQLLKAIEVAA